MANYARKTALGLLATALIGWTLAPGISSVALATSTPAQLVADINDISVESEPTLLRVIGSTLYFTAYTAEHGRELWRSDGTEAGTVMVKDINPADSSSLVTGTDRLYFVATSPSTGYELWMVDLATPSTSTTTTTDVPAVSTTVPGGPEAGAASTPLTRSGPDGCRPPAAGITWCRSH